MIGRVLYWRAKQRMRTIAKRGREAGDLQRDLLLRLVQRAKETRFGKDHDFANVHTLDDYREGHRVLESAQGSVYGGRDSNGGYSVDVVGEDGLVALLQNAGYTLEPVE